MKKHKSGTIRFTYQTWYLRAKIIYLYICIYFLKRYNKQNIGHLGLILIMKFI